jgi:hypothetical protein
MTWYRAFGFFVNHCLPGIMFLSFERHAFLAWLEALSPGGGVRREEHSDAAASTPTSPQDLGPPSSVGHNLQHQDQRTAPQGTSADMTAQPLELPRRGSPSETLLKALDLLGCPPSHSWKSLLSAACHRWPDRIKLSETSVSVDGTSIALRTAEKRISEWRRMRPADKPEV